MLGLLLAWYVYGEMFPHIKLGCSKIPNDPSTDPVLKRLTWFDSSMTLLEKMLGDDSGLLDNSFLLRTDYQPNELRHAPGKRRCTPCALTKCEMRWRGLRLIPNLLGNHSSRIGELQHRIEIS